MNTTTQTEATSTNLNETMGGSGLTALVHKQDAEGSITIDPITGHIITSADERPEWAEELTVAQIGERHVFYTAALGDLYTEERQMPEVFAFEDLGWLGARELPEGTTLDGMDHDLLHFDADHEFRQQQVATVHGLEAELDEHGDETGSIAGLSAIEVELREDNLRSPEEIAELEKEQATGYSKTGTSGE
jgi:hypothetical protein